MSTGYTIERIVVIDRDEDSQRILHRLLSGMGYEVICTADARTGVVQVRDKSPNLVIVEVDLFARTGLDVCRELKTSCSAPILALSSSNDENTIVDALARGADGCITKPFRPGELLARIRALLRRRTDHLVPSEILDAGDFQIDLARRRIIQADQEIRLTRTQFDIIVYLARHPNRVITTAMILRHVWGEHHGDYDLTLRVHISQIRKKLEANPSNPRYVLTEPGVGYRLIVVDAASNVDEHEQSGALLNCPPTNNETI